MASDQPEAEKRTRTFHRGAPRWAHRRQAAGGGGQPGAQGTQGEGQRPGSTLAGEGSMNYLVGGRWEGNG